MGVARDERLSLCGLLDRLGPDAPTLCEGWRTREMAAHLVTRDRRFDAIPAYAGVGALEARTTAIEERVAREHDYRTLVRMVREGPPLLGPFGLPVVRELLNVHEYFIHHEDVRRPNRVRRRRLSAALEDALTVRLRLTAGRLLRRVDGIGVVVRSPDGRRLHERRGSPQATVTGPVAELTVYLYNRRAAADVDVSGDAEAVGRLAATRLGP